MVASALVPVFTQVGGAGAGCAGYLLRRRYPPGGADREAPGYRLACDTLLGKDEFRMNYLSPQRPVASPVFPGGDPLV